MRDGTVDKLKSQVMFFIILIILIIVYFFYSSDSTSAPLCNGAFSGGPGPWSSYAFDCLNGVCSYTVGGVQGNSPVFAYSVDVGNINISPPNVSGTFFIVMINCTGRPLCGVGNNTFSMPNNSVMPEGTTANYTRTYTFTEGLC